MRISVFGLGYVGCVSAACLAAVGHEVVGVDVNQTKVELINEGKAPVVEERIGELTDRGGPSGALRATTDVPRPSTASDMSLVCVGTPVGAQRQPVHHVSGAGRRADRRRAGRPRADWHTVVFRSTMLPGTCRTCWSRSWRSRRGKTAGVDFGVAVNPEFLREGTSVRDFFDPPKTVIGELDDASGDCVAALYEGLPGEVFRVPIPVAEMTKYADNAFHGLKIGFANELGAICQALGRGLAPGDGRVPGRPKAEHQPRLPAARLRLRRLLPAQGPARPGPRGAAGRRVGARPRPRAALQRGAPAARGRAGQRTGKRRIGLFGLSFKPGTDDLRESPLVELAERLLGKGYDLRIYDANVTLSRLLGANREYIETRLPHLASCLTIPSTRCWTTPRCAWSGPRIRPCSTRLPAGRRRPRRHRPHPPSRRRARRADPGMWALAGSQTTRRALILVENLSVPFDRRVWQECTALRDAGLGGARHLPAGGKRDTERERRDRRGADPPLPVARGHRRAGRLPQEYGSALWHTCRLARKVGPVDVVHACNPPDLLFLLALGLKRRGARFVFDQHDLVPELYLSRFDRGEDLLYRALVLAGEGDLPGRGRGDRHQRELPRRRDRPWR